MIVALKLTRAMFAVIPLSFGLKDCLQDCKTDISELILNAHRKMANYVPESVNVNAFLLKPYKYNGYNINVFLLKSWETQNCITIKTR
jgi:hypothetical protein